MRLITLLNSFVVIKIFIIFAVIIQSSTICSAEEEYCTEESCGDNGNKPNFIILLADDLGYADLASYGHPSQEWGPIDQMAAEGVRFTQFYAADSLCTPSRAGLLTGRLPVRLGMFADPLAPKIPLVYRVLLPNDKGGLPKNESTIAELLKPLGYVSGMVGKWHLGINAVNSSDGTHLPGKRGFDFVGTNLPFTLIWNCDETGVFAKDGPEKESCFIYHGDKIVQQPIRFDTLTARMVKEFKDFIGQNEKRPFFFFFSFPQTHVNLYAAKRFNGSSVRGLYGDNLNEMSWAIGEVLASLKLHSLDKKTLVIFMSDHGGHESLCQLGGVSGPFNGQKAESWEGGFRIPAITWWPGTIPGGRLSSAVMSSLDLLPTFLHLAGGELPSDRLFDGRVNADALMGREHSRTDSDRLIYFYCGHRLMAVRYGLYKVHFNTIPLKPIDHEMQCPGGIHIEKWYVSSDCSDDIIVKHDPPLVFHLGRDPREAHPLDPLEMADLIAEVKAKVSQHLATVFPGKVQHGNLDDALYPCCDPPKCECDHVDGA